MAIRKELNEQKLSIDELLELESALISSRAKARKPTPAALRPAINDEKGEFVCQAELNFRADCNVKIAKAKLELASNKVLLIFEGNDRETFKESQDAWEDFSDKQARFLASSYEGGTMYPLIYLSELERLITERTLTLETIIEDAEK